MFDFITNRLIKTTYSPVNKDTLKAYNLVRPGGAKEMVCFVPFNSLTFSWHGKVYACTYNRNILVGEYPKDSIRDIWFGKSIKKLRGYLEHNDLSYGCQHCNYFLEKEKFSGLKPQTFDKYYDYKKKTYPRVMEFELSNTCNLECIMCNGNTSSAIRKNRDKLPPLPVPYNDEFVEQLKEFIPHLREAKFFGGEPFLIEQYYQIWDKMMELNPWINIFVITNGTVLNQKIKSLLEKGKFELAISIDSIRKERYERIRKNSKFETVMENLNYLNEYSQTRGKTMSLSFTTQRENWDELPEVIEFCNKNKLIFFNSFLTAPFELSLIFLSSEELRDIHNYLSKYTLPETTELEKYNKNCFTDYLKYLKHYEEKNKNGIDYTEQKDNYNEAIISERVNGKLQKIVKGKINEKQKFKNRNDLYEALKTLKIENEKISNSEIIDRIEQLFTSLNDEQMEQRILADLSISPIEIMINDVSNWSQEELYSKIKKQFSR